MSRLVLKVTDKRYRNTSGKHLSPKQRPPSPPTILGQRCRAEGGGGGGGSGAAAQVSSPAMVLRTWSFSPRSLFSFSSSSSSKNKLKKKQQQQQNAQHQHQRHQLHNSCQRSPYYPCSSNSSPSPGRHHWCDNDDGDGATVLDPSYSGTGIRNLSVQRIVANKATTSLSLPLTPRPPVHTPVARAPPVAPAPPSMSERYRQLLLQRPQSQSLAQHQQQQLQQRKKEKPEKDRFRFRRWHPKKRKRNVPGSAVFGSRPLQSQQVEGDYHRLAHHLGQGHYNGHAGVGVRVQGRGGSLSHSCTDTSSCSNSGLNHGSDGGGFGAGSSSLDEGGSSSNNDSHYPNSTSKTNHYSSSGCVSSSNNGSHKHYNSNATNQYSSSGCASSNGFPAFDSDHYNYNHLNNNSSSCNYESSSPSFGHNGNSDENGEVFSPVASIRAFNFNRTSAHRNIDFGSDSNILKEHDKLASGKRNNVYEVLLEDSNTDTPSRSSFGLTPENCRLKSQDTSILDPGNCQLQLSEPSSSSFRKRSVFSVPSRYSDRAAISSSSSSNIPCSFLESVVSSPNVISQRQVSQYDHHLSNNNISNNDNHNNNNDNEIAKIVNGCVSCDDSPIDNKNGRDPGDIFISSSGYDNNSGSNFKNTFTKIRSNHNCSVNKDLQVANTDNKSISVTENVTNACKSLSCVDEFLGASKLDLLTPPGPNGLTALDVYLRSRDRRVMVKASAILWLMKLDQDRAARARLRHQEEQRRKAWMRRLAGGSSGEISLSYGGAGDREEGLILSGKLSLTHEDYSVVKRRSGEDLQRSIYGERVNHKTDGSSKRRIVCHDVVKSSSSSKQDFNHIKTGEKEDTGTKRRGYYDTGSKGRVGYEWRNAVLRRGRKHGPLTSGSETYNSSSTSQKMTTNSFYRRSYRSDTNDENDDCGAEQAVTNSCFRRRVYSDNDYKCHTTGLPFGLLGGAGGCGDFQTLGEVTARSADLTPSLSHKYFLGVMNRYGEENCFHRNPSYGWRRLSPNSYAAGSRSFGSVDGHPLQVSG